MPIVSRDRPKIGMCENRVRHPRGTRWAISRSKIDALDIRNRIRLQFYARWSWPGGLLGVSGHRILTTVSGIEMPIVCRDGPEIW
jgi:hypothetical protein